MRGIRNISIVQSDVKVKEDVDKLIWNNLCYVNLANYLVPLKPQLVDSEKGPLKIGLISKGCVGRALIHLAVEKQIDLDNIKMIGVEAAGLGIATKKHAATLAKGEVGVLHGAKTYVLQDKNGQIQTTHSISAGLDYPGVGPEHSYLKKTKRVK